MKKEKGKRNIQQSKRPTMQEINSNVRLLIDVFGLAVDQEAGSTLHAAAQSIEEVKSDRRQLALFDVDGL